MPETWLASVVVRDPGPLANLDQYALAPGNNPYGNEMRFIVNHSAEGYFGTQSPSSVMRARGNSWHITIYQNGHTVQSYPLEAVCWHSGPKGNFGGIGIEHEGKAGEALTPAQLASTIRVQSEIARLRGWAAVIRNQTGFEHNQFMATSCPSGRIPWAAIEAGTKVPAPVLPVGIWPDVQQVSLNVHLYQNTNLVRLPDNIFVKALLAGTDLVVKGIWRGSHYLTAYSFDNRIPNGFAVSATVAPAPPPVPPPAPVDPCADLRAQVSSLQGQLADQKAASDATIQSLENKIAAAKASLQDLLASL